MDYVELNNIHYGIDLGITYKLFATTK